MAQCPPPLYTPLSTQGISDQRMDAVQFYKAEIVTTGNQEANTQTNSTRPIPCFSAAIVHLPA